MTDEAIEHAETPESPGSEDTGPPESDRQGGADQPAEGDPPEEGQGELSAEVDDGLVDLEIDGQTFRVPPQVRDQRLMHEDYTRKTQELAAQRRALEQQPSPQQVEQEDLIDRGTVTYLEASLNEYEAIDWAAWENQDLAAAQAGWRTYQDMQNQLRDAHGRIAERQNHRSEQHRTMFGRQVQETQRVLTRDIKGWGPELASKVTEHAKSLGFDDRTIAGLNANPAAVKALYQATMFAESQRKNRTANRSDAKPLDKPKGRAAPAMVGPRDNQSIDAWMKQRNSQAGR